MPTGATEAQISAVFREEYGRAVAILVRTLGSIDAAEDAVQEAFAVAARRWPVDGIPPAPAGWIVTTARRRAIDAHRSESARLRRESDATLLLGVAHTPPPEPQELADEIPDERLRLLFTC